MSRKAFAYLGVGLVVNLVFFLIYGFTNHHAESAQNYYRFYFEFERGIPLVPAFILIYFSIDLLFLAPLIWAETKDILLFGKRAVLATIIAGSIFYLFPAPTAFERPKLVPAWQSAYDLLFTYDRPFNTFPSLHITFSLLIVLCIWGNLKNLEKIGMGIWFSLICLSVLLTHQHQVMDIVGGVALTGFTAWIFKRETRAVPNVPA